MSAAISDLSKYLLGARKLLLDAAQDTVGILEASRVVALARAAEMLGHLAYRQDCRGRAEAAAQTQLLGAWRVAVTRMNALDIEPPLSCADNAGYPTAVAAFGALLNTLSQQPAPSAPVSRLLRDCITNSISIEYELLNECDAGVRSLCEEAARQGSDERLPTPSADELTQYLRGHVTDGEDARVLNVKRRDGVNSKAIFALQVAGIPGWPEAVILRQDRRFKILQTSAAREFALMKAIHAAGLPVPRPLWAELEAAPLRSPFLLLETLPGTTVIPTELGDHAAVLGAQMAKALAQIHRLPLNLPGLPAEASPPGAGLSLMIETCYQRWQDSRLEPSLLIDAGFAWLRTHADVVDDSTALVHGDFDLRNILVQGDAVSAVLDWELAHIGHPAEDLAYCRADIVKLIPWEEFLRIYEAHGGPKIQPAVIDYFGVWASVFRTCTTMVAAGGYIDGKHQEMLLACCAFIDYPTHRKAIGDLLLSAT